jgi:hypothetical protein
MDSNNKLIMKNKIIYPKKTTYYICYNLGRLNIMAYGKIEPANKMQTGQPIMDVYLDIIEWENVLLKNGIKLIEK